MRDLDSIRRAVAQGEARRDDAAKQAEALRAALATAQASAEATRKAQALLQEAAAHVQHELESVISSQVQGGLDLLFPGYTFKANFLPRRGKTEAEFHICKGGLELDPLASSGGGVVDAIAFALRVGCLRLSGKRQVLILDEPFKHVRGEPRKELGRVVSQLSGLLGVQVLMVGDVAGTNIDADQEYSF